MEYAKNCERDPPIDMVQGSLDTQLGSAWQQSAASAVPGPDVGIWRGTPVNCLPCVDHLFIQQPAENHLSQSHTGHSSTLLTHLHPPRLAQSLHVLGRAVRLAVKNDARLCFAPLPFRSSVAAPRVVSYTATPPIHDQPTDRTWPFRLSYTQPIKMATNGAPDSFSPETILAAMTTMRGGEPSKKKAAMDYLSKFQKSVGAFCCRRRPSVTL